MCEGSHDLALNSPVTSVISPAAPASDGGRGDRAAAALRASYRVESVDRRHASAPPGSIYRRQNSEDGIRPFRPIRRLE
jgi:hypothetical protein